MKAIIIRAVAILVVFCSQTLQTKGQGVEALIDMSRFKLTDSTAMLELNLMVLGKSVNYAKQPGNKRQAKVNVAIEIADSSGIRAADKLALLSPVLEAADTASPDFQSVTRYALHNGKYTLTITSQDNQSKTKEPEKVVVPFEIGFADKKSIQISDIQLLSSYKKAEPSTINKAYYRNGYELIARPSNFYPEQLKRVQLYTEIYETATVLGNGQPLVITYGLYPERIKKALSPFTRHVKRMSDKVVVLLAELDVTTLPSGNYRLVVEVRDAQNKLLATQSKNLQRSNPPALVQEQKEEVAYSTDAALTFTADVDSARLPALLMAHQPIATTNEMDFIAGLIKAGKAREQRLYLEHFWKRRGGDKATYLWQDYVKRIAYVNEAFATKNYKGYQTDRGRVYLQYGPPNQIQNERNDVNRGPNATDVVPYQIWQYYHIGSQNNKIFVFVQNNRGNDNYRLTHSDMKGEPNNPEWRKEVIQKFSGSKFDR